LWYQRAILNQPRKANTDEFNKAKWGKTSEREQNKNSGPTALERQTNQQGDDRVAHGRCQSKNQRKPGYMSRPESAGPNKRKEQSTNKNGSQGENQEKFANGAEDAGLFQVLGEKDTALERVGHSPSVGIDMLDRS
jgi:hypothetical protein